MKKRTQSMSIFLIVSILILSALITTVHEWNRAHPPRFTITMLNIGQGDAAYLRFADGSDMLIDAGPDRTVLSELSNVMPWWDHSIDTIILTHPDSDHIAGFDDIIHHYTVGRAFDCGIRDKNTRTVETVYQDIDAYHIPLQKVYAGEEFHISSGERISILSPSEEGVQSSADSNLCSIVLRVDDHGASALFTGDAPAQIEENLIEQEKEQLDIDLLKVSHHGSNSATTQEFLDATTPTIGLISAGKHNRYHHPHPSVVKRLIRAGIDVLSTIDHGRITCVSTGNNFNCRGEH